MLKILYSLDINQYISYEKNIVDSLKQYGYDITIIDWFKELGLSHYPSLDEIEHLYNNDYANLLNLYQKIRTLANDHDVFIVSQSHVYLPQFIESLENIYTVFYSADDPESSDECSKPYVKFYDHIFAAGVNFNEKTRITEKFLEWGAKKADWWPLGFRGDKFNPDLTIEDIYNGERDIDVVFMGDILQPQRKKKIIKIKKAIPQIKIFSRYFQDFKYKLLINSYFSLKTGKSFRGYYLPENKIVSIYQRTKIGINMHLSYGPSNMRLYQLPANGVMQLCDCPEGLSDVFEVGEEVVLYNSIEEAIELVKYYLDNDEERKKIAVNGFIRTINDYNREKTFLEALKKISESINNSS